MAAPDSVRNFEAALKKWRAEISIDRVIKKEYGTLSLQELEDPFNRFQNYVAEIDQAKADIPTSILEKISAELRDMAESCKVISNVPQDDFSRSRASFRDSLSQRLDQFELLRVSVLPIILQKLYGRPQDYLKQSQEEAIKLIELRTAQEKEFEDFKQRFKDIYSSPTIAAEKDRFQSTAAVNLNRANYWLGGIVFSCIVLITWLIFIAYNFCFDLSCYEIESLNPYKGLCASCGADVLYFEMAKSLIFRIFIVAFLLFIVTLCVRNHNANMHNYSVNKHKANSLDAALYLLSKASPQATDQIISQASNAIFSHQPTGFSKKGPENFGLSFIERFSELFKKG